MQKLHCAPPNRVLTWPSNTADNPAMWLLERKLSSAPPNSLPRTPTAQSHCLQTTCEKLFERKVAQKGLMGTRFCSGGKTTAGQNFLIMWTILHSSFFRIFFNESLCQPESSLSTSCKKAKKKILIIRTKVMQGSRAPWKSLNFKIQGLENCSRCWKVLEYWC